MTELKKYIQNYHFTANAESYRPKIDIECHRVRVRVLLELPPLNEDFKRPHPFYSIKIDRIYSNTSDTEENIFYAEYFDRRMNYSDGMGFLFPKFIAEDEVITDLLAGTSNIRSEKNTVSERFIESLDKNSLFIHEFGNYPYYTGVEPEWYYRKSYKLTPKGTLDIYQVFQMARYKENFFMMTFENNTTIPFDYDL